MATTIITKNGSGAPVAGDLVQGELAVDLTNKTLYSKDSSGNVFKVGDTGGGSSGTFTDLVATDSFTSPGIDDNATSTQITVTDTDVDFSGNIDVTGTLTASGLLYPTTDGTEGQAVLTDGNGTLAFGDVVGGIDYTTETSNYTLEANQGVIANTTGGTFVVTLPLAPAEGDQVVVADGGDWAVTNLTVGRNGQTIEGVASDLIMDVGGISVTMVYDGTTWQLYPATGISAGTSYTLDQTTTAGNVTTNNITVGNLTSKGIDDNATSTAITIDANGDVITGDNLLIQNKAGGVGSEAEITFVNSDVLSGESGRASIVAERVADSSGGYDGSTLTFSTTNGGTTADLDPRVTIDASGNTGIGTDAPSALLHCAETASGLTARFSNEVDQTLDIGTEAGAGAAGSVYLDNPNSGNMEFRIGGTERMRIDVDGNVGIGTNAPSTKLDLVTVNGSGVVDTLRLRNTGTSFADGARIQFTAGTSTSGAAIGAQGVALNSADLVFYAGGNTERMRIDADGNTTINAYTLELLGTGENSLKLQQGTNSYIVAEAALYMSTAGVNRMWIDTNGRVDITGSLYVNGTPKMAGTGAINALRVNADNIVQDGAPVVDSLQIIRAFMKMRDAVDDPDSTVEELRAKLKVAVVDIIDQFQDQIDTMPVEGEE